MGLEKFGDREIYTLAESRTNKTGQNNVIVNGEGSDLNKRDALKGRAKRKTITQIMMLKLIDIAQKEGEPELEKSYWNTYYCQQNLFTADDRLYGKYCKNRFCTLCCSIRKAEMINKYHVVLKEWKTPYFLTLTVKSCKAGNLSLYIKKFIQGFQRITEKHRKRYQRGKGKKLIGIRSLECNFNPIKRTYNPHFHIITKDKEIAEVLLSEWLKLWTPKFARRPAQNIQKVNNLESGLIEIIKYGSKIFTEPDLKKRKNQKDTTQIYIKALNTILTAMKGKRIFDRFGFNLPKQNDKKQMPAKLLTEYNEWEYDISSADWINIKTGEVLTNYKMPSHLEAILSENIDLSMK
ncbi:protein rep [Psychroserpens luteolus]|uniref:protein rep n=1 Tax=Psychroserpens luteolus TaxID=2855840 RepID=UPI001E2E74EB|nr:protein rep [Psychroserpens luteolus]MCD2259583.1 protein rep [Psychroserpens luteolus]